MRWTHYCTRVKYLVLNTFHQILSCWRFLKFTWSMITGCEFGNRAFPAKRRPTQYSTGHLLIARHTSSPYVGNKNKFDASGFSSSCSFWCYGIHVGYSHEHLFPLNQIVQLVICVSSRKHALFYMPLSIWISHIISE